MVEQIISCTYLDEEMQTCFNMMSVRDRTFKKNTLKCVKVSLNSCGVELKQHKNKPFKAY